MSEQRSGSLFDNNSLSINKPNLFVYVLLIPSLIAYHALERAKFIYFIPLIILILPLIQWLSAKNKKENEIQYEPNMIFALLVYSFIAILSISINNVDINYTLVIRDILIILSPLIVFSFKMKFNDSHLKFLFIAVVISYFAWVGFDIEVDLSFNFLKSNYNTTSEFHNGVIIGGFFLFFLYKKKYLWLLAAAALIIMSGKRSLFLGIIPAVLGFYLFVKPFKIYEKRELLLFCGLVYFLLFYFISINLDTISEWFINDILNDRNYTLHRFLMGREVFITYLKEAIHESDLINYLFGYGPGQADVYLKEIARPDWGNFTGDSVNPHNDFLKMKFDYGLIGSVLMFFVFYSAYFKSKMGIMMFLYTIPLFLVDNSFIFIYFWFIALVIARYDDQS